jgi:predicted dehydrogenase
MVLDDPAVEAVHLATPPFLRGEIAVPLLRAGKSVLCEKPLALSLDEADRMIETSRASGSVLGINYVMRHHPAFRLLLVLASSGLFGAPSTVSLLNFAQALPPDHWMWDIARSGGILVEHGVHFFDAYGQIVGQPAAIWGSAPRKEAAQVTIQYAGGATGTYYHEFAFPQEVERTHGILLFEQGYVEIDGWIPERMQGKVLAPARALEETAQPVAPGIQVWREESVTRFEVRFPDRSQAYKSAIVDGMRDLIASGRDHERPMIVSAQEARGSLALALAGQRAIDTGTVVRLTD